MSKHAVHDRRRIALLVAAAVLAVTAAVNIVIAIKRIGAPDGSTAGRTTATQSGAQLTDPASATAFLAGAISDIAAVSSYDYRRLDDAVSLGLAVTTAGYRSAFHAALTGTAARLAVERATGDVVVLMMAATLTRTPSSTRASRGQYGVTVVYADQTRITSDITPVVGS